MGHHELCDLVPCTHGHTPVSPTQKSPVSPSPDEGQRLSCSHADGGPASQLCPLASDPTCTCCLGRRPAFQTQLSFNFSPLPHSLLQSQHPALERLLSSSPLSHPILSEFRPLVLLPSLLEEGRLFPLPTQAPRLLHPAHSRPTPSVPRSRLPWSGSSPLSSLLIQAPTSVLPPQGTGLPPSLLCSSAPPVLI